MTRIIRRAFIFLILCVMVINVATGKKIHPPGWTIIPEIRSNEMSVYYKITAEFPDKGIRQIMILASSDNFREIDVKGKKIKAKSITKAIMADCKKGVIVPSIDFYYSSTVPGLDESPIAAFQYTVTDLNVKQLERNSLLYQVFCPVLT